MNRLMKFDPKRRFFPSIFSDDFFSDFFEGNDMPATNITETDNEYKIELSVPGFDKNDFDVQIEKNVLTISAKQESRKENKDENEKVIRQEFRSSAFSRSFIIPENTKVEDIKADHKDGVLKLTLPKMNVIKSDEVKKITIG